MQGPALGFERQIPAAAAAGFSPLSSSALSAHIINNLIKEGRRTTVTLCLIYGRVLCTQERIRSSSTQFRPAVSKPNSLLHRFKVCVFFFSVKASPLWMLADVPKHTEREEEWVGCWEWHTEASHCFFFLPEICVSLWCASLLMLFSIAVCLWINTHSKQTVHIKHITFLPTEGGWKVFKLHGVLGHAVQNGALRQRGEG